MLDELMGDLPQCLDEGVLCSQARRLSDDVMVIV